jgi:transcriptional antiterminator RfaH
VDEMINWYAVQAKNHNEARVLHHLTERIIPTFLPLIEVTRHYGPRRLTRLEPLFPGYLFVQLECLDRNPIRWDAVRWAPGVKSILNSGGMPTSVPDSVIDAIKIRVQDLGFVRPGLRFGRNDRVLIRCGPLAGLEAVFERPLSSAGRVLVLMRLLGQQRRVQVDAADLELA